MKKLLSLGLALLMSAVSFAMEDADSSLGYSVKFAKHREAGNRRSVEGAIAYFDADKLAESLNQYTEYVDDQYTYIMGKATLAEEQKLGQLHTLIDSNLDKKHAWEIKIKEQEKNVPKHEDVKKEYQEKKDGANSVLKWGVGGLVFAALGFYSIFRYRDFFENHSATEVLVAYPTIFSLVTGGALTTCGVAERGRCREFLKESEKQIKKANDNLPKMKNLLKNYNPHFNFDYDLLKKASGFAQMQFERDMEMRSAKLKKYNSMGQTRES